MQDKNDTARLIGKWAEIFIHRSISDFFSYSKSHDLSMSQIALLFQLAHRGIARVSSLADKFGITPAAVSQMIDNLVKQGLVTRQEATRDRRMKQLELTDRGKKMIQEIMQAKQRWFKSLIENMSEEEREIVTEGLKVLIKEAAKTEPARKETSNI